MMDSKMAMISTWSYGLSGLLAAFLALYLASSWKVGGRSRAMFLAVSLCAVWGLLGMAFAMTHNVLFLAGSMLADSLRFGGWYLFLILLVKPEAAAGAQFSVRTGWLGGIALLLVVLGFGAQLLVLTGVDLLVSAQRLSLFLSLAMSVFGLVLLEQLFRNVSPDFRWSIKPLCLGLGGTFLFDLYLFSDALLFNQFDVDAFSIRGFVHAVSLPLVALSAIRSHAWKRRLVMSQRAALQSATLVKLPLRLSRGMVALHADAFLAGWLLGDGAACRAWSGRHGRESRWGAVVEGSIGPLFCSGRVLELAGVGGHRG